MLHAWRGLRLVCGIAVTRICGGGKYYLLEFKHVTLNVQGLYQNCVIFNDQKL